MKYSIVISLIIVGISACSQSSDSGETVEAAYYGFYPSDRGPSYKRFVHNIFGFELDMPSSWVFGVNGQPPTAVVFLYPDNVVAGTFADNYEMIEIGRIPLQTNLDESLVHVFAGMQMHHEGLKVVEDVSQKVVRGNQALSWVQAWPSKSGYTITEWITLIQSIDGIRSITVRTTFGIQEYKVREYSEIINSFSGFRPSH